MALPLAAGAFTAGAGSKAPARAGGATIVSSACCAAAGSAAGPAAGAAACAPAAPAMHFAGAGATACAPVTPAMRIAAADVAAAVTAASSYSAFAAADTCRSHATCWMWPGDWRCAASRCRSAFQMPHAPQACGPEAATALRWPWLYEQEGGQEIAQAAPQGGRESDHWCLTQTGS